MNAQLIPKEARIQLAIQAIEQDPSLSVRRAAQLYNAPRRTLNNRRAGMDSRRDCQPNSIKLSKTEESVIVQHILDLDTRGFPPRLAAVQDMANSLLAARAASQVGKNWAENFIKRTPELKVKFNRKYDYSRAKCEDPKVIGGWFRLIQNMKAKYGI
jgi:hypothetical protein